MQISGLFSILAAVGVVAALPQKSVSCPGAIIDYVVQTNDTLTSIATKYDSGICQIALLNNLSDPNYVLSGVTLKVPTDVCDPDNSSCLPSSGGTAPCVIKGPASWTVQSGETFYIIAQKLGLNYLVLEAVNPNVEATDIAVGQVIDVPVCPCS
ncbi:LysM domain-containing protein [Colletotrichum graminicola M1.001]|uniref:LysM domain-containing protein n=1 Tax=Colletotrichum graminicola (strain M1.001 / M2 / FGSC 10212) TaxID=645133 RepID=E3QNL0_COLGM|nr:LysM domain-containing protein [Colletotrichum graminicola M1.001]EFQ32497.1 LysM domain-containing protein [Colletotrichum graminicola M1.001]